MIVTRELKQPGIAHGFFGRQGGHSTGIFASLNCGLGSGDDRETVVRQLAAGLGIELDEVTETHVRVPAPEAFDIASGHIEKGTTAAMRFEVRGIKDGDVAVVLEHVTRLRDDLCPDWPQPAQEGVAL